MTMIQMGSNIVVNDSVAGSVFPTSEAELAFPILVDGTKQQVLIEGALYGRSVELRGKVRIRGPVLARGDMRIEPGQASVQLDAGLTVNGSLNCVAPALDDSSSLQDRLQNASVIIKGDIAANQSVSLKNAIVFGSIRAVNCALENTLVLGTCIVDETLKVSMSSIGGYACRDVTFEGHCLMVHALGESLTQPLFVPYEALDGVVIGSDLRYYPAIRSENSIMNRGHGGSAPYPEYSRLYPNTDWVCAGASANPALEEHASGKVDKWILSLGGRISDISRISKAVDGITQMLKCGFEFEHYHPARRAEYLERAMKGLTEEEQWILKAVCLT